MNEIVKFDAETLSLYRFGKYKHLLFFLIIASIVGCSEHVDRSWRAESSGWGKKSSSTSSGSAWEESQKGGTNSSGWKNKANTASSSTKKTTKSKGIRLNQISYQEYKRRYTPHNEFPNPDLLNNDKVKLLSNMPDSVVESLFNEYLNDLNEKNKKVLLVYLFHIPREKAGRVASQLNQNKLGKFLKGVNIKWTADLLYYMEEPAFNEVKKYL